MIYGEQIYTFFLESEMILEIIKYVIEEYINSMRRIDYAIHLIERGHQAGVGCWSVASNG